MVRMLMVNAMRGDPEDRPAFERERAADGQEVLDPLRRLVAAMRQQAVVAHADAERAGDPPQDEHRRDGAESMKKNAATAPTWNDTMAMAVIQLMPWRPCGRRSR